MTLVPLRASLGVARGLLSAPTMEPLSAESTLGLAYWRLSARRTLTSCRAMFERGSVATNISAGITVALVAIPLNLALAIACGLPPAAGLVTGAVAGILGAFLGASPYQITGPEVALAPITLAIVAEHGFSGLIAVTFLAGLMQIAFGVLRLGGIVNAIPVPVIGGFLAAVGLLVFDSQLPRLLGLPADVKLLTDIRDPTVLSQMTPAVLGVGLVVIGVLVILPRCIERLPAPLVAVALATAPILLFDAPLPTVSAIESAIPTVALPTFALAELTLLLPSAAALALLASTDSLLCAVSIDARKGGERTRSDQELVAQGLANMASACFGGMPVAAAVVRSVTAIEAGATTRLAALVQSVVLGLVLVVLGGLVAYVPLVALAAILLVVGARLVQVHQLRTMWRLARFEALVFVATAVAILVADFVIGVVAGVVASLGYFAHQQRLALGQAADRQDDDEPTEAVEAIERSPASVSTVRLAGPLFFGSQDRVADLVSEIVRSGRAVLDVTGVTTVDTSGALALGRAVNELIERGVEVRVWGLEQVDPLVTWGIEHASDSDEGPNLASSSDAFDDVTEDEAEPEIANRLLTGPSSHPPHQDLNRGLPT